MKLLLVILESTQGDLDGVCLGGKFLEILESDLGPIRWLKDGRISF